MKKRIVSFPIFCLLVLSWACSRQENQTAPSASPNTIQKDVCIYGATASGIMAALAVKREGKSVVIVEPSRWVGGMLGAGIKPQQDCPNIEAVGGSTRPLLETLGVRAEDSTDRQINPYNIREDFLKLLEENEIQVVYDHRISSCVKEGSHIVEAFFDRAPYSENGLPPALAEQSNSLRVHAEVYIDAGYDADLMARAGVSYLSGRESTLDYQEELAGVRPPTNLTPIDPFQEPGNPESALLPWVENDHEKPVGAGDQYTQAYNYRFYVTADPEHKIPLDPPGQYDPNEFELVGRYVEHLRSQVTDSASLTEQLSWIFPGWMNAGEYNYQRASLITMAPVGISHRYINGDYATKACIWQAHQDYLRGLHHFMSTDDRVPEYYRSYVASLGLDQRPYPNTNGWPHQLYIRVSRRMVGRYTITAHDVYNRTEIDDPVGLAQYGIDTYPSRRIWLEQNDSIFVALEGKMFVGGAKGPTNVPYPVSYRSITPQEKECSNLIVPVCFSATHLGYASARMEPVFMICGESAGVAAAQAIDENTSVQTIDKRAFQQKLRDLEQLLEWNSALSQAQN